MASVILAGTTSTTALNLTGDTSGELQIKTNNGSTTAMTLTTGGNVGIGTASPTSSLVVSGSVTGTPTVDGVHVGTQSGFATLELCGTSGTGSFIDFTQSGTDFNGRISYNNSTSTMQMFNQASGALLLGTSNTERMRIDSSGNVGIGTSSPGTKLVIKGDHSSGVGLLNLVANSGQRYTSLSFYNNTSARAYIFHDNTDSMLDVYGAAGQGLRFTTNDTERMRIDSNGNVGIGTSSPSTRLHVAGGDLRLNNDYAISWGGTGSAIIGANNTLLRFDVNGSERVRIDSSGNVGIGTSSPFASLDVVQKTSDNDYAFQLRGYTTGSDGSRTVNMRTVSSNNGDWANFRMDATSFIWRYQGSTERMRITSGGNLLIGTTSDYSSNTRLNISNSTNAILTNIHNTGSTSTTRLTNQLVRVASNASNADVSINLTDSVSRNYWFGGNNGGAYVVANTNGVRLADGGTSWASDSDERVKDIIEPITDAANKVSQLRSVIGKYKTDEEGTRRPFLIAQDVQAVLPEAVFDEQGTLMLAYTDTIPLLVAAIKEQQAMIEELRAEVELLKSK